MSNSQAGAHPNITTAFAFTTREPDEVVATPKDVRFDLPVGFVGNTVGMPRCSMAGIGEALSKPEACPSSTMVGTAQLTLVLNGEAATFTLPVYNVAPAPGEPAAFAFNALVFPIRLDTAVLSDGNYGVRVTSADLSEAAPVVWTSLTFWGVPSEHNGPGPDESFYDQFFGTSFGGPGVSQRVPLLTNPQQCSEPVGAIMQVDSWVNAGDFLFSEPLSLGTLTGCEQLRLSSSFSMVPDTLEAGAPAGYHFDLRVPQNNAPKGLGDAERQERHAQAARRDGRQPVGCVGFESLFERCSSMGRIIPPRNPPGSGTVPVNRRLGRCV